jgi:hypothetical protein
VGGDADQRQPERRTTPRGDSLSPPRSARLYFAMGLVLLLGVLNFLPFSWNPNWFC